MQVTVELMCSLHTRLLQVQDVDFTLRCADMKHNSYVSALVCYDCKFVDGVT